MKSENQIRVKYAFGEDILLERGIMRVARSPHRLLLPERVDEEIAYLAGYLLGDGYIEDFRKTYLHSGKGGYEITFADRDFEQLKLVQSILKDKFGIRVKIYGRSNQDVWILKSGACKVLHWYLHERLALPMGRKIDMRIPIWALSDRSLLKSFLSGFFDAEADVSKSSNGTHKGTKYYIIRIQLTQKNKALLQEIQSVLLNSFQIKSHIHKKWNQEGYILRIRSGTMARRFMDYVDFRNPTKKEKLHGLVHTFEEKAARGERFS